MNENNMFAIVAIVAIVAVVVLISLVMGRMGPVNDMHSNVAVMDQNGNVIGNAYMASSLKAEYRFNANAEPSPNAEYINNAD